MNFKIWKWKPNGKGKLCKQLAGIFAKGRQYAVEVVISGWPGNQDFIDKNLRQVNDKFELAEPEKAV
jgi:hypothetical protein